MPPLQTLVYLGSPSSAGRVWTCLRAPSRLLPGGKCGGLVRGGRLESCEGSRFAICALDRGTEKSGFERRVRVLSARARPLRRARGRSRSGRARAAGRNSRPGLARRTRQRSPRPGRKVCWAAARRGQLMAHLRLGQGNSFQRGSRTARALTALALALAGAACSGGGSSGSSASSQGFAYLGPRSWTITGPQGGPFTNTSMDFMLLNTSSDALDWTASSVPAFLQLDMQGGSIPANSQRSVHATLNAAMAQALPAGDSQGSLTFHDVGGGQADVAIDCDLSISVAGVTINLSPGADFASTGPAAGPFTPPFAVYTL